MRGFVLFLIILSSAPGYGQKYCTVQEGSGRTGMGKAYYLYSNDLYDEQLKDAAGKNFKSFAAVLNYMDSEGFVFETAFTRTRGTDVNFPTLIFSRNDELTWTVQKGRIVFTQTP